MKTAVGFPEALASDESFEIELASTGWLCLPKAGLIQVSEIVRMNEWRACMWLGTMLAKGRPETEKLFSRLHGVFVSFCGSLHDRTSDLLLQMYFP